MIVATHLGMFMPALRPDHAKLPESAPELQVRARRSRDLQMLREYMIAHELDLGPTIQLPKTDYQFRAYCTREAWGKALAELALDIDYVKFKDTPAKYHGDKALSNCYSDMWGAIFRAFPKGSVYGTAYGSASPRSLGRASVERRHYYDDLTDEPVTYTPMSHLTSRQRRLLWETSEQDRRVIEDQQDPIPPIVNGHLDHSGCSHARTKSARRSCRKRWMR